MRLQGRVGAAAVLAAMPFVLCASVAGQEPVPSPSPGLQPERLLPPAVEMDRTPRRAVVPGRPSPRRDSAGVGRLKDWRAQSLREGEGRLLVDGAPRLLKTGDSVGGYVVKAMGPGRVVLADATSVAIITFDAGGVAHVRLVLADDPTRQQTMAPAQ